MESGPVAPSLAIVGGGPSVADHIDELREWDGEIWSINGAWRWCRDNDIDAAFYTIDPMPCISDLVAGADRAILADWCDPSVFAALDGAHVELAELGEDALPSGSTSACTGPAIAAHRGHRSVALFGCESNYAGATHVYKTEPELTRIDVECGGAIFETSPQMLMQAEYLGPMLRDLPMFLTDKSGGLLSAYAKHGECDVVAAPRHFVENLSL
jgi:hypothetical protein